MSVFIDRTGLKYNMLTVIKKSDKKASNKKVYWDCICDCGNLTTIMSSNLGRTKSCGCMQVQRNHIDITGNKYGKLTVIKLHNEKRGKALLWVCKCDCGNIKIAAAIDLKQGKVKACSMTCSRTIDLTNKKIGKLTVVKLHDKKGNNGQLL